MPYRKRHAHCRGIGVALGAFYPIRPNVVWALDFQFDQTADRRTSSSEHSRRYSRECLAIDVERRIDADGVVAYLERLVTNARPRLRATRPRPELITYALSDWCPLQRDRRLFIDPAAHGRTAGSIVNGRLRDEYLDGNASIPFKPRSSLRTGASTTT